MLSKFAKRNYPIAEEDVFESGIRKKKENHELVSVILRCPIVLIV